MQWYDWVSLVLSIASVVIGIVGIILGVKVINKITVINQNYSEVNTKIEKLTNNCKIVIGKVDNSNRSVQNTTGKSSEFNIAQQQAESGGVIYNANNCEK